MITTEQVDQFNEEGFLVIRNAIPDNTRKDLETIIDRLHREDARENEEVRWDMRNCIRRDPCFLNLLCDPGLLSIPVRILGWNIKLLTSHIVKIAPNAPTAEMPILFHQDGGALSFELAEPLPQLILKMGYCISGDTEHNAGQLQVVPGSNRLVGPPIMKTETEPYGAIDVVTKPGDLTLLDWRCWHAVSPNKSSVIRRNLYFGFGPRWLMPMDYESGEGLPNADPVITQLFGGKASSLGHYLPSVEDTPLKTLFKSQNG